MPKARFYILAGVGASRTSHPIPVRKYDCDGLEIPKSKEERRKDEEKEKVKGMKEKRRKKRERNGEAKGQKKK